MEMCSRKENTQIYNSIDEALSIRDAIFHKNKYRRGEAYFEAVKIFGRQLNKEELEKKFLQILEDYRYEQSASIAVLKGFREVRGGELMENPDCISCSRMWNVHSIYRMCSCPYYLFLSRNAIII